jgi:hypothetical protein
MFLIGKLYGVKPIQLISRKGLHKYDEFVAEVPFCFRGQLYDTSINLKQVYLMKKTGLLFLVLLTTVKTLQLNRKS